VTLAPARGTEGGDAGLRVLLRCGGRAGDESFVEPRGTRGDLERRSLGPGSYRIEDYVNRRLLRTARGPTAVLKDVNFTNNLLLRAVPVR
jgi:hypothetical protein